VYLRDKLGLVEMNSLLEKEAITPKLGGSTDILLIYGQSFSSSGKWSKMGSSFPVRKVVRYFLWIGIFQFGNWSRSDNHFVIKMV
jgi:hypothetical protein